MALALDLVLGMWLVLALRKGHAGIGSGAGCGACAGDEDRFLAVVRRGLRMRKSTSTDTCRRLDLE